MTDKKMPKNAKQFVCEICNVVCCKNSNYKIHLLTNKHKNTANAAALSETPQHICQCGKIYKHRQSLFNHKQKCSVKQGPDKDELILTLTKQTVELQTQVIELCKKGITHTTNNNNSNNNNNNTFNLNFFLNETCKDAMNLEDFINSIVWKIADLKMVGNMGYVKGFSKLISDKLNLIAEDKRPIHCTDAKREVMYVKDDNKWEKEPETKPKLHRAVKKASRPQIVLPVLTEFRELNPEYKVCESNVSTEYKMMISEALCGGEGENEVESVIKNISKNVLINKALPITA